jgi:hypothetical protein
MRHDRDRRSGADMGIHGPYEDAAQLPLRHGAERVQRLRGHHGQRPVLLDGQVAHLGAVAVHHRQGPARVDERCQAPRHDRRVGLDAVARPRLAGRGERVAPDRDDGGAPHAPGPAASDRRCHAHDSEPAGARMAITTG